MLLLLRSFLFAAFWAAACCCVRPTLAIDALVPAETASSLATEGDQIRQLAFDGQEKTCFVSSTNAHAGDWFELRFDQPVSLRSVTVATGRAEGGDELESGALEITADGERFERVAGFSEGRTQASFEGRAVTAMRIVVAAELSHPLVIGELKVESTPKAAIFRYPVEFIVDAADEPELNEWAHDTARTCERAYPLINDALRSDGYQPPRLITFELKDDYRGVAATGGSHIVAAVNYFSQHRDDVGAIVHETVHVVQQYRGGRPPGWLVEGIADYVRFFKFEPGKLGPIDARRAHYNGSYRVSAAFLAYVAEKYDVNLVPKLNAALRAGEYREELFRELTGKGLDELDEEWRATLKQ